GHTVLVLERYYEAFKWSNSTRVVPLRFLSEETYTKEKLVPVRATSCDLWFKFEENYNVEMEIIELIRPPQPDNHPPYEYRPSLVKPEGMILGVRPEENN
ncbi:hypothetical protein PanWU01x14_371410, partial [Parasponia andersonii]